ncbi:MAG TPA: SAM-dependent methyltransferase [Steroidobacteraceae bacterium]|nr:SAM-dependent methyltransferase [Steroidobacteraceae bacterium]
MSLPPLSADERGHAERVRAALDAKLVSAGGWIPFSEFMQFALYEPGLGYYSAGARKFGADGDFITAPELTPLFGQCIAQQVAEVFERAGGRDILEFGAGSGALAVAVIRSLAARGMAAERYDILEVSADLRERQREFVHRSLGAQAARVHWLDRLPAQPLRGAMLANEVLDALPVERFRIAGGRIERLGVALIDGELAITARPAPRELEAAVRALAIAGDEDYESELCPLLPGWIAAASQSLAGGVLFVMDYGLPRAQYYHPDRRQGSLLCHHRHRAHADALAYVGLQDLTAWVDFTAAAEAADSAGLDVLGFTTQAQFLLATGMERALGELLTEADRDRQAVVSAANRLLLPGEMGEAFKVMALGRGVAEPLQGFMLRDLRHTL